MLIVALVRKDLQRILRDRKALVVNLALPLVLTAIMGLSFGGSGDGKSGISAIPIAMVADNMPGFLKDKLATGLEESGFFTVTWTDSASAEAAVRSGRVAAALVMPDGLLADVLDGREVAVQLWKDPGSPLKSGIVQQILERGFVRYQAGAAAYEALWPEDRQAGEHSGFSVNDYFAGDFNTIWKRFREAKSDTALQEAGDQFLTVMDHQVALSDALASPQIKLTVHDKSVLSEATDEGGANLFDYILPSFAVFFLMFAVAAGARDVHREKVQLTLQRQLLSPMRGFQFIVAKWLAATSQGILQLAVLFVAGALIWHVNLGPDPYALAVMIVLTCATGAGVFILLALLTPTEKIMDNLSTVVILVSAMIGGNFGSVTSLPAWAHAWGRFVFNYWANLGFVEVVVHNHGLGAALGPVLVLGAAAVTLFVVNVALFGMRSRRGGLA